MHTIMNTKSILLRAVCAAAIYVSAVAASAMASGDSAADPNKRDQRTVHAAAPSAPAKTCPEILLHKGIKDTVRHLPLEAQREAFTMHGIEPLDLDSELVALYVTRQLGHDEIEALRGEGVRILARQYVPAVPGRHPLAFYLASIDYAALDAIEADARFARVSSVETALEPTNDLGLEEINAHILHSGAVTPEGKKVPPIMGAGVAIAVADSGVDLSHPDLPVPVETYDVTSGEDVSEWSTNVANTAIWHGTHVSGTAVGSGASSDGKYAGPAPLADFHFYKIGNNSNGNSSNFWMILAINRALEAGCRVFTVSYGGFSTFMDGSSALCQAFDNAFENGMIGFSSAGNMGARKRHVLFDLAPSSVSEPFDLLLVNPSQNNPYTSSLSLRVLWQSDEPLGENGVHLNLLSELGSGESFNEVFYGVSPRGTETKRYVLAPSIPPGGQKTYVLQLSNETTAGGATSFHVYQSSTNNAVFPDDDPLYTVTHPAFADTVVAVGAWRHRAQWTDYFGQGWFFSSGDGILAPFSSRGPRIDGLLKPEIVAPGSMTISLRDPAFANASSQIISSTGQNDGSGPAHYYIAQGTSMASPIAAGAMTLLLEREPNLTPAEAVSRVTSTASHTDEPNPDVGYGMINMLAALALQEPPLPGPPGDLTGDGVVGVADLLLLLAAWGECGDCADCLADLDEDCVVGVSDLLILLANWS